MNKLNVNEQGSQQRAILLQQYISGPPDHSAGPGHKSASPARGICEFFTMRQAASILSVGRFNGE